MQGEVEPLLPPGSSRAELEERWVQEDARRRGQHRPWWATVGRVCVLVTACAAAVALASAAIFSPEFFEGGGGGATPLHSPAHSAAAQRLHAAHKNVERKHRAGAPSTGGTGSLKGTGGFFTGEASSAHLIDESVSPCSDFYEHACGQFTMQPLPGDHDQWFYAFDGVKQRVAHQMRAILSKPSSGPAGRLYRSCVDEEAIERAGTAPLTQFLLESQMRSAGANRTAEEVFVHTVAALHRINSKALFFWNVGADADSSTQVMYMEQGGLTLPSHTYYINSDPPSKAKVKALHTLVSTVLRLLGHAADESEAAAASVVQVETDIAKLFLSHADERKANSLPPLSFKQVAQGMSTPGFDWMLFFRALGIDGKVLASDAKVVRVLDVNYYQALCKLLASKPVGYWKHYLKWNFLDPLIGHLGKDFQHADLMFRKTLYGVDKDPPRWRICLHTLNSFVPVTIGAVYKDATFRADSALAHDVQTLLQLLRAQFNKIIAGARWMSPASRTVAQKKLALMDFEVGGSAHVKPLPFHVEEVGGWFNNSVHIATALVAHQIHKLGTIEGRTDWGEELGPMSVNAFYNVHANTLFVPAALLQEPFFPRQSPLSSDSHPGAAAGREALSLRAQAFGSIGGLLGHEMSHGFDNVGRLFGPDLVIKDWWDPATKLQYTQRAQCVGHYYHSFREAGRRVDGNTTLGEDIADKGGLHTAYNAMVVHLASQGHHSQSDIALAKIHFFEAWAQT